MAVFSHQQRVRFPHVDHAGIAFFASLLEYCHNAHEEWLQMLGYPLPWMIKKMGIGLPLVRVDAEFASPARHGDLLRIDVRVAKLGVRSIQFKYEIYNETTLSSVGTTTITQVSTAMEGLQSTEMDPKFRRAIEKWMRTGG